MNDHRTARTDVAIVGGGIIGLAAALELLDRGCSVTLFDAGPLGGGATRAAGGMLAPVSEADIEDPRLVGFGLDSLAGYRDWTLDIEARTGLSCEYRDDGAMWVAVRHDDMAEIDHLAGTLTEQRLPFERLDAKGVRQREPRIGARLVGGLWIPSDHQVNPRALTLALAAAVRQAGARIFEGTAVERIAEDGTAWRVEGGGRRASVDRVLVAHGAPAGARIHPALEAFPIRPVKGQAVLLHAPRDGVAAGLLRHVIRTPQVYLIPRNDGSLYVGATLEEMGHDTAPTAGPAMDLLRRAWETLPGVYESGWDEITVGLRPATADHLPLIGAVEDAPGLFVSLGHYRNGILLAPASARHLARAMLEGEEPPELEAFRPGRLSSRSSGPNAGRPAAEER